MKINENTINNVVQTAIQNALNKLEEQSAGFHACASHVKENATGREGRPINHTLLENGTVTHYTVEFENEIVENIPSSELTVLKEAHHGHAAQRDDDDHDKKKKRVEHDEELEEQTSAIRARASSAFDELDDETSAAPAPAVTPAAATKATTTAAPPKTTAAAGGLGRPSALGKAPKATAGARPPAGGAGIGGGGDFGRPGALGKRGAPTKRAAGAGGSPPPRQKAQPRPGSLGARIQQRRRDRASQGLGMTPTEKRVDKAAPPVQEVQEKPLKEWCGNSLHDELKEAAPRPHGSGSHDSDVSGSQDPDVSGSHAQKEHREHSLKEWYDNSLYNKLMKEYTINKKN